MRPFTYQDKKAFIQPLIITLNLTMLVAYIRLMVFRPDYGTSDSPFVSSILGFYLPWNTISVVIVVGCLLYYVTYSLFFSLFIGMSATLIKEIFNNQLFVWLGAVHYSQSTILSWEYVWIFFLVVMGVFVYINKPVKISLNNWLLFGAIIFQVVIWLLELPPFQQYTVGCWMIGCNHASLIENIHGTLQSLSGYMMWSLILIRMMFRK